MFKLSENVLRAIAEARRNGAMFEDIEIWVDDSFKDEESPNYSLNIFFAQCSQKLTFGLSINTASIFGTA